MEGSRANIKGNKHREHPECRNERRKGGCWSLEAIDGLIDEVYVEP
jgi:hypothetical protein